MAELREPDELLQRRATASLSCGILRREFPGGGELALAIQPFVPSTAEFRYGDRHGDLCRRLLFSGVGDGGVTSATDGDPSATSADAVSVRLWSWVSVSAWGERSSGRAWDAWEERHERQRRRGNWIEQSWASRNWADRWWRRWRVRLESGRDRMELQLLHQCRRGADVVSDCAS